MFEHDATTFEIGQARLRLRDGLRFTLHQDAKRPWYLVEDDVTGQFYRIGLPEYTLLSVLDGVKSLAAAVAETSALLGGQAFGEREAAHLCRWVIESGLAETDASKASTRVAEKQENATRQQRLMWLNPISLKFPLFNPDPMVATLNRAVGWLVSWPVGIVWFAIVTLSAFLMWANWDLMVANRIQAFGSHDLFWIILAWVGLKGLHETSHALVCKRFGGDVPQFGILLLLLIPMPFVDVTSSWRFTNKFQRILTSAAGMIVELFVAAVAVLVWHFADPGPIRYHAENIIFVATVGTVLFNANPLMRFDGYYILADWLEIPNLYQHGRQYVKGLAKAAFFAAPMPTLVESGSRARTIMIYGFASTIWFFVITVSLMVAACGLLEGFGLILALIGAAMWFGIPLYRFVQTLLDPEQSALIDKRRLACASGLTVIVLLFLGWVLPAPSVFTAPIVFDYERHAEIRAQVPGFLTELRVNDGDQVQAGQVLAVLEDPALNVDYKTAGVNLREARLRASARQHEGDVAGWQNEQETLAAIQKRLDELGQLIASLQVRAPHDGVVLTSDLASTIGTYVNSGQTILEIGDPDNKHAIAMLRQSDSKWLNRNKATCAMLSVDGGYRQNHESRVEKVQPRTQDYVPHPAFAASLGGVLAVIDRNQVDDSNRASSGMVAGSSERKFQGGQLMGAASLQYRDLKLTHPRVRVDLALDQEACRQVSCGQTGTAYFRDRNESLGSYLFNNAILWLRHNLTKSHGI